jgi:surfactin synthase thioesterase subunit
VSTPPVADDRAARCAAADARADDTDRPAAALLRLGAPGTPRRRLVCLPFAGGGAATYRQWTRFLPEDVEVVSVQLPGRELARNGPPLDSIDAMAAAAHGAVRSTTDLPYAVFGHSMGALIAFELAFALEHDGGRPPVALFVSGRRPPDETDLAAPVHGLPDAEFLDELQRRYGGVPDVVRREPELLALLLPGLRADVRALETYRIADDTRVACPVHVYGGREDTRPRPDQLEGWTRRTEQPVRVQLFPGGHFFVAEEPAAICADIAARWAGAALAAGPT